MLRLIAFDFSFRSDVVVYHFERERNWCDTRRRFALSNTWMRFLSFCFHFFVCPAPMMFSLLIWIARFIHSSFRSIAYAVRIQYYQQIPCSPERHMQKHDKIVSINRSLCIDMGPKVNVGQNKRNNRKFNVAKCWTCMTSFLFAFFSFLLLEISWRMKLHHMTICVWLCAFLPYFPFNDSFRIPRIRLRFVERPHIRLLSPRSISLPLSPYPSLCLRLFQLNTSKHYNYNHISCCVLYVCGPHVCIMWYRYW